MWSKRFVIYSDVERVGILDGSVIRNKFVVLLILQYIIFDKTIKINLTNISSDSTYFNDIDRVIITNNINTLNGKSTSIIENSFKRNLMY